MVGWAVVKGPVGWAVVKGAVCKGSPAALPVVLISSGSQSRGHARQHVRTHPSSQLLLEVLGVIRARVTWTAYVHAQRDAHLLV